MEQYSIAIAAGILALIAVIVAIILSRQLERVKNDLCTQQKDTYQQIAERMQHTNQLMGDMIGQNQNAMAASIVAQLRQMESRIGSFETGNEQKLENMRTTIEHRLSRIQADNNERLDEMRKTVDEKLQQTLESKISQSFRIVNERLEQVYKGLGEMQTLAIGVGDLKKVLSNVKSRGIVGEIQLGAILEEVLSPEQYDVNVVTIPGTKNYVEFAIKLPAEEGMHIYLPIDAKFPADAYANLQDAYEAGLPEAIQSARATLCARLRQSAKDIRDKYITPPYTTEFAILFLPFEGLYAEAVNRGMIEQLQRDFRVSIAGPSTMAVLLNSLQMGFKTIAIQRRSGEVWNLLGAVKNEFDKFGDILALAQQRIDQANKELDKLVGTRTRSIIRKLKDVERLDDMHTTQLLGPLIEAEIDEQDEEAYNGE